MFHQYFRMRTLRALFQHELGNRFDAEKRLIRVLPKLGRASTCKHLRLLLNAQLKESMVRVKLLQTAFTAIDAKVRGRKCAAVIGLLEEAEDLVEEFGHTPAINAALVSVVQKLTHHSIVSYGSLNEWASLLGLREASSQLKTLRAKDQTADQSLEALALARSNPEALDFEERVPTPEPIPRKLSRLKGARIKLRVMNPV